MRKFFDRYLKDVDNGWEATPKVRLSVLNPGGKDIVNRVENEFPLARTQYTKLYLSAADDGLHTEPSQKVRLDSYDSESQNASVTYRMRMDKPTEITGYMKLHAWVSTPDNDDMDLSVRVEKLTAEGKQIPDMTGNPIATTGQLRVSLRELDESRSTPYQPVHRFENVQKLKGGEIVPVEIEIWPMGLKFEKGEILQLTVGAYKPVNTEIAFGSAKISVPKDGYTFVSGTKPEMMTLGGNAGECADSEEKVTSPATHNKGRHVILTGGDYDSYLLVPVIPEKH